MTKAPAAAVRVDDPVPLSPAQRRRRVKFDKRREAIVDLAAELFATNGYAATGIREIGDAAGLARGALYYYIESKESLLSEIHDRVLDPLLERAREIVALDESASARLRLVSIELLRLIIERHDHVWVFLHEYRSLTGERRQTFRRKRADFENLLLRLFNQGVANGEFEIADLRLTLLAFLGMHNYTYQWAHTRKRLDPVKLSKVYCDIFLDGIACRS
jgi:AcrR family transcriptional regulator